MVYIVPVLCVNIHISFIYLAMNAMNTCNEKEEIDGLCL